MHVALWSIIADANEHAFCVKPVFCIFVHYLSCSSHLRWRLSIIVRVYAENLKKTVSHMKFNTADVSMNAHFGSFSLMA